MATKWCCCCDKAGPSPEHSNSLLAGSATKSICIFLVRRVAVLTLLFNPAPDLTLFQSRGEPDPKISVIFYRQLVR